MKIGIVGWGVEGQSAYRYFGPDHEYLIVNEHQRDDFPPQAATVKVQYLAGEKPVGVTGNVEDLSYLGGIETCEKIIYTPTSLPNLKRVFGDDPAFWSKATTDRHIFFETVKTKNIIGVTGTKGKGTTSTLIHHILEAAGKRVFLGGNIGKSVLDFVNEIQPDDWAVLELSSFQLKDFPYSPHIAVCLMIVPEHLDWHPDVNDYVEAKANIFKHQSDQDTAIYFPMNQYSTRIAAYSKGRKIPYFHKPGASIRQDGKIVIGENETEIIDKSQVKLLGEHNLQNICAAITAAWQVTNDVSAIQQALKAFSGLEHRLEFVRELNDVKYYDDSFGTTPETAIVAMQAFTAPKVIILGGSDKGLPFDKLADAVVQNNVRHAVVIGETAPKIISLLRDKGFASISQGMQRMSEIVTAAYDHAQPGDVVLLSTGCASFGLFKDYKDRGNQFKQAVLALS